MRILPQTVTLSTGCSAHVISLAISGNLNKQHLQL
jgi:hypothetical protein